VLVYEVYVEPRKTSLLVEGASTPITTGMSVTTEIKVGKRRIIEFFISFSYIRLSSIQLSELW